MLVPDLVEAGLDVVVTVRTPWAHAASYKRLGWISKAAQIYPRWSARYGPCGTCEEFMSQAGDRVVSAALLWRLSYLPLLRTSAIRSVRLVTSEALERDERSTYLELIRALGLTPTARVERALSQVRRETASSQMTRKTHDWSRSITSLNTYWKEVLTAEDLEKIQALTSDMLRYLFPSGAGSAAAVEISSGFDPDRHNFPKDLESSG
jgi:hypothetical protein